MNKYVSHVAVFVLGFLICAWSIYYFYGAPSCFSAQAGGPVSHRGLKILGQGENNPVRTAAKEVSEYVVNIDTVGHPVTQPTDMFGYFFGGPRQQIVPKGQGSGVIFTPDGYIVTNNHVVKDAAKMTVTLKGGKQYSARLIGRDPRTDLAVIKIDARNLPFATFADSDTAQVGDWVIAVGSPLGFESSVTVGVISATGRNVGGAVSERLIQTDASINPGNSGGALADLDGKVVGINVMIVSPSGGSIGIGFAIPSNLVRKVANQLKASGKVIHPWLGVSYLPLDALRSRAEGSGVPVVSGNGVVVQSTVPGSPAARAGLEKGDVIRKINGMPISADVQASGGQVLLNEQIEKLKVGDKVELEVLRASSGQTKKITVKLAEMPENLSQPQEQPGQSPLP